MEFQCSVVGFGMTLRRSPVSAVSGYHVLGEHGYARVQHEYQASLGVPDTWTTFDVSHLNFFVISWPKLAKLQLRPKTTAATLQTQVRAMATSPGNTDIPLYIAQSNISQLTGESKRASDDSEFEVYPLRARRRPEESARTKTERMGQRRKLDGNERYTCTKRLVNADTVHDAI